MLLRYIKSLLVLIAGFGLLCASYFAYQVYLLAVKPMGDQTSNIIIEVKPHSTAKSLIYQLYDKQLVSNPKFLLNFIRLQGLSSQFKAGFYRLQDNESTMHFLKRVVAGDVMVESFQIIEGSTIEQVSKNLLNAPYLFFQHSDWQAIKGQYPNAEGLVLADTYHYNAGSNAQELLQSAHKQLRDYLESSWQNRQPGLPYKDPYELLIVASILEKEASVPSERKIISGVILNRLEKNMPLQMDPTVIYAYGALFNGKLKHDQLLIDSPYNTYRYRGLPPTPIAIVGKISIDAAAHPTRSQYIYFVAKGDGTHVFSRTYDEQRKAIKQYLSGEKHE